MDADTPQASSEETTRKFIHVDMDCFYAAVEMRDDPTLTNLPLAIGGRPDQRGVVATCNYPARTFGIHSAMATAYARRLCPDLIVLPPRMAYYQAISREIRAIFHRYTDLIEPISLDEAYLDVTDSEHCQGSATRIAAEIRQVIFDETGLTASAGIAPIKFLAKICSDENKPNGQFVLTPSTVDDFVRALPLKKIPGVGKVTQAKLGKLGLITCQDIRDFGEAALSQHFGSFANHLFQRAWGHDPRRLTTEWIRKSVSVERTFSEDLTEQAEAAPIIERLTAELKKRLTPYASRRIKNQQVKLKFSDFTQTTVERQSDSLDPALTQTLLESAWDRGFGKGVRLIGLGVHFYDPEPEQSQQLALFEAAELQGAP
ncbi:DNA polymerase IV [Pseudomonadales bacterium]|nr:DNA polymerase IV [Pseudomonadales bacterium]